MHTVELYRKVRLACRDGMSERAAALHFGISRESVKKMLCFSVPPGYRRTAPVRRPKLDGFTEIIDQWLKEDLKQLRKQRHTAKRIFDRLRAEHGFSGGYTIVPLAKLAEASGTALSECLRWEAHPPGIMCCHQTPHDAHGSSGAVSLREMLSDYWIYAFQRKSYSRGRGRAARWASATSSSSRFWNWCGSRLFCPTSAAR